MTEIAYTNPRMEATIDDWPIGRQRCRAWFRVEGEPGKERVARQTENKTRTGWNKPKRTTYSSAFAIVDGSDGRTYLLCYSATWGHIVVWSGNCQHTLRTIARGESAFDELLTLIQERDTTRHDTIN